MVVTATITTGTPTVITSRESEDLAVHERRPSWRLKVDNGTNKVSIHFFTKIIIDLKLYLLVELIYSYRNDNSFKNKCINSLQDQIECILKNWTSINCILMVFYREMIRER